MRSKSFAVISAAAIAASGCAQSPKDISATYVSPILYQNLSCEQLALEAQRISARVAQVSGVQEQKATGDAVAMGVGLVLFWPALFFIKGDRETAAELSRLRGEIEAIQQASIANNCGFRIEIQEQQQPSSGRPVAANPTDAPSSPPPVSAPNPNVVASPLY